MKEALKNLVYAAQDSVAKGLGLRDRTIPPHRVMRVSTAHDYVEAGEGWKAKLIEVGGLRRCDRVLEVGCGSGRVARCLLDWLDAGATYDGFDILRPEIEWLQSHITPDHPGFRFRHVDVYNAWYNEAGVLEPGELDFPYESGAFDFVYLTSVFTHMLPDDVDRYLGEIKRVLAPGGRCCISYFLLNTAARANIAAGRASRSFAVEVAPHCYSDNAEHLEQAIAYDETDARARYAAHGLDVEAVHFGQWSSNPSLDVATDHQDIVAARRR